jgi:alpha,alpha-trehalase
MKQLMVNGFSRTAACVLILALPGAAVADEAVDEPVLEPPSELFGDFFSKVAMSGLFVDSKQWADAVPKRPPEEILARAHDLDYDSPQALGDFLNAHFELNPAAPPTVEPTRGLPICEHIAALWPLLTRKTAAPEPYSSRLPLPHPYVVPGGRFREVYYWDSYFTMLGLGPKQAELKRNMVMNFAHQIRTFGHIPNGNRTYYLSRSQAPFFHRMVGLLAPERPAQAYAEYLPELRAEHAFWMEGAAASTPDQAARRVVTMPDGSQLNRYWDARDVPRDESNREDVEAAEAAGDTDRARLYRDIRAAAESGWDFSSRWFADGESVATTRTTAIVPVDLNSLLYGLEQAIALGCHEAGDAGCASRFEKLSLERRAAMHRYLWNEEAGVYDDWLWTGRRQLGHVTAATLYPLFTGVATEKQAERIAAVVREDLLETGGLVTTNRATGQQWDAPNGWPPLQWIAVTGLRDYGQPKLAETIAKRWLALVTEVYASTGKLLEKYNVVTLMPGGGGEYPLQDGFGWTNGVTVGLFKLYPAKACESAAAEPVEAGGAP